MKSAISERKDLRKKCLVTRISYKKSLDLKISLKGYLNLWRRNVASINIHRASYVISRAFKKFIKNCFSKKKLTLFLRLYYRKKTFDFIKYIKNSIIKVNEFTNACIQLEKYLKSIIFKRLYTKAIFLIKLKKIIQKYEEGKNRNLLRHMLRMWKNYKEKDEFILKVKINL